MDWGNDYFTFSDTNIEYIWRFLRLGARARLAGTRPALDRVVPTLRHRDLPARADRQLLDRTDPSISVRFPLLERKGEALVIWTTTPVDAARRTWPPRSLPTPSTGASANGDWVAVARFRTRRSRSARRALTLSGSHTRGRSITLLPPRRRRAPRDRLGRGVDGRRHRHRPHRSRVLVARTSSLRASTTW